MKTSELIEKANIILTEKGLTFNEKIDVANAFKNIYKDEYPFIFSKYEKGEIEYYYSTIDAISLLMFENENEVILANAIYENTKDDFNMNDFLQQIRYIFRILNLKSIWCE